MQEAKICSPSGRIVIVRALAKRLIDVGDPFLAAAEKQFVKTSVRVGLRVVGGVGDDRLDLLQRQVPSAAVPGLIQAYLPRAGASAARRGFDARLSCEAGAAESAA
jgi:hypothetical protein